MERSIKVRLFGTLRLKFRPWEMEVPLTSPMKLRDLLDLLEEKYPGLRETLLSDGELRKGVIILKGGQNVWHLKGLETEISPGDTIVIFPPGAGG